MRLTIARTQLALIALAALVLVPAAALATVGCQTSGNGVTCYGGQYFCPANNQCYAEPAPNSNPDAVWSCSACQYACTGSCTLATAMQLWLLHPRPPQLLRGRREPQSEGRPVRRRLLRGPSLPQRPHALHHQQHLSAQLRQQLPPRHDLEPLRQLLCHALRRQAVIFGPVGHRRHLVQRHGPVRRF